MPVSLAVGQVSAREFPIKVTGSYVIAIEAKKRLPLGELCCMMKLSTGPSDPDNCDQESLIQALWIVRSEGQIVDHGNSNDDFGFSFGNDTVERSIGHFRAESGNHYTLDVNFTRNAAALDVTDPHLVLRRVDTTEPVEAESVAVFVLSLFAVVIGLRLVFSRH